MMFLSKCLTLLLVIVMFTRKVVSSSEEQPKKNVAVATLLTTSQYVAGAEVLALSLQRANVQGDRVLLYYMDEEDPRSDVTEQDLLDVQAAGWNKLVRLTKNETFSECKVSPEEQRMLESDPEKAGMLRFWGTCSKFAIWSLTDYDKVVYMDADGLVLHNFDFVWDYELGGTLYAQGTPGCWDDPPVCDIYYTAFLLIKPMEHLHKFLYGVAAEYPAAMGEIHLLNQVYRNWKPLPRYTMVAQSEAARPLLLDTGEVDWSQVKVYDFAGSPETKPWKTYKLQKDTNNPYAHPFYGTLSPDSKWFQTYAYPQSEWNKLYDEVLQRKQERLSACSSSDGGADQCLSSSS